MSWLKTIDMEFKRNIRRDSQTGDVKATPLPLFQTCYATYKDKSELWLAAIVAKSTGKNLQSNNQCCSWYRPLRRQCQRRFPRSYIWREKGSGCDLTICKFDNSIGETIFWASVTQNLIPWYAVLSKRMLMNDSSRLMKG